MNHPIPFYDLSRQYQNIKDEVTAAFTRVCQQNAFSGGPFVDQFEKEFASFCSTKFAVGVNSGTSALHLALLALGIKPGDEVIIPANTFIATAWAASYVGATPVFVDCRPDTWNIDPKDVVKKITLKTRLIIGVHLYGQPFDVDAIADIASSHKITYIEDCAQAQGAKYKGKTVGSLSPMGCFSFYPGKNLGAFGEAGAVTTNNSSFDTHIRSLRNHGSTTKYYHDEIGFNMRMEGLQAAILSVKLKHLSQWNSQRKKIANTYQKNISNPKITLQCQPDWSDSVYHLFVVTVDNRSKFQNYLQEKGIGSAIHYPVPCHLQKAYSSLGYKKGDFPHAEQLAENCVSLPMFPELTDEEVNRVIDVIDNY